MCTHHLDGHVTVQIHLPLLTATLVLQLEPGRIVVVWTNIVNAAEPVIQHAYTPDELLVLEIIEDVFSSHRPHTVPNRIVSTTRRKTTTTRHRDANTLAAGQSADEEHEGTTAAVATMVQPFKGTVNDIKNLVRELHQEHEQMDHGELPLRNNRDVRQDGTCRGTTKSEHTLSRTCICGISRNKHSKHCAYLSLFPQKPKKTDVKCIHCGTKNSEQMTVRYEGPKRETNTTRRPVFVYRPGLAV